MLTAVILSSDIAQSYFEDGNFHHMVVTVNGTQVNIYLDGDNRAARFVITINTQIPTV